MSAGVAPVVRLGGTGLGARRFEKQGRKLGWSIAAAGLAFATASIAAATAHSFETPAEPALPDDQQWRTLAIDPIADGSGTGLRSAAQDKVELLPFKPARPERADPSPVAAVAAKPTSAGPSRFTGSVGTDLIASLRAAGVPDSAATDYVRALATRVDLSRGLGIADRFDLIVDGKLAFAGLDRLGAADVMLMRWNVSGRPGWIDASGVTAQSAGMAWPVSPRVSSGFGMRLHPLLGFLRFHRGIDLKAGWGEPIRAAADGRVSGAGWAGGYGRQVRLAHAGGLATSYSHMSSIAAAPGQTVRQGQVIGYVGSSGLSTGPHLHYEVFKNGRPVNPSSVRFATVTKVELADRQAFRNRLRELLLLKPRILET